MAEQRRAAKRLRIDRRAKSARPDEPAFIAPPSSAPVYHGFPLVEETRTDGWCFGAITDYEDPNGCEWGDGFVVAPDGSRAGIVWGADGFELSEVLPPDEKRWGVYHVPFPKPIRTTQDLVECFRAILPKLKEIHARVTGSSYTQA
jgi:hypothetical protein